MGVLVSMHITDKQNRYLPVSRQDGRRIYAFCAVNTLNKRGEGEGESHTESFSFALQGPAKSVGPTTNTFPAGISRTVLIGEEQVAFQASTKA